MITIKSFASRFEANVMASKLEANGIMAILHHQDSVFTLPTTFSDGRIELKVHENDVVESLKIMQEELVE